MDLHPYDTKSHDTTCHNNKWKENLLKQSTTHLHQLLELCHVLLLIVDGAPSSF